MGDLRGYPSLANAIAGLCGPSVTITGRAAIGGGCINDAVCLELSNGERLFYKQNRRARGAVFHVEARGLTALRCAGRAADPSERVRLPIPLAIVEDAQQQGLVLEFIAAGRPHTDYWRTLGRGLAQLHGYASNPPIERFGLDEDNWLGATPQQNGWLDDWPRFFAERRLLYQIELARRSGRADSALVRGVERIAARIDGLLPAPQTPSLLHGDLWSGNIMADETGRPVLIDPAIYWGNSEADMAMSELFGGFAASFYSSYTEVRPHIPGYDRRRDLYNLYHILNHLNLFGQNYAHSARAIVRKYA